MAKVYAGWPYGMVQLGREVTAGTAVAATVVWRGLYGSFEDQREREKPEEQVGLLVPAERSYDTKIMAGLQLPATPFTYEQGPHVFEAGIMAATPSGSDPYTRSYTYSTTTTPNEIQTYTLRAGNVIASADQKILPYSWVSEFELSGNQGESWQISSTWMAQQLSTGTFTTPLSLEDVDPAIFGNTVLYIDDSGGTIGTTPLSGVLMGFSLRVQSGIKWVPVGDGNLYSSAIKYTRPEVTFTLTLELEQDTGASTIATERGKFESDAVRLIRLNCPGSGNNDLTIDLAAKYDSVGPYDNNDENTTVTFEGHAVYSSTDSLFMQIDVDNSTATY